MAPDEVLGVIANAQELYAQHVQPYVGDIDAWLRWAVANVPALAGEAWEVIKGLIAIVRSVTGS